MQACPAMGVFTFPFPLRCTLSLFRTSRAFRSFLIDLVVPRGARPPRRRAIRKSRLVHGHTEMLELLA